jgi:hypothetical protein
MVLPPFRRNRSRLRNFALGDEYIIPKDRWTFNQKSFFTD